jgi:lipoprotein-releasing system permease protein
MTRPDWPFEVAIGWRYVRAGRAGRRNGFISFISAISVIGIALGVMALIVVLSVMNGFQKEVRDRMLSIVAHVEIYDIRGEPLADWRNLAARAEAAEPKLVTGAAPFVSSQSLVGRGETMRGAIVRGVLPEEEARVTDLARLNPQLLAQLKGGEWNVVMGRELARLLSVQVGEKVTLVSPTGQMTPAGVVPRLRQFTLVATFDAGHYEYDSGLVLVHLDDAARLYQTGGATAIQLRLSDVHAARDAGTRLQQALGGEVLVRDWTRTNRQWFDAVQIEKRMIGIILSLIVAVAAFNLVSTLVMTVTDKRADIAILRTLGASPRSIMGIFIVQGATSGVIGTVAGVLAGLAIAFNVDVIVPAIERLLGLAFLPGSLYIITKMPSQPLASDIVPIAVVSLVLAFLATLYPSWRASRTNPAEALRYE